MSALRAGVWYTREGSVPFLFWKFQWNAGGQGSSVRGIIVTRDGTVMEAVRSAGVARRMVAMEAPEGAAYRECERRWRELSDRCGATDDGKRHVCERERGHSGFCRDGEFRWGER